MGRELIDDYPQYSVAMCTYNGEKYIGEQLYSILEQTIIPAEIVISDDGSNDQTLYIAREILASNDIKFSIIQNQGEHGIRGNFYNAIRACKEPIIFTCDQDDVWLSHKAATILPYFAEQKTMLVFTDGELVNHMLESLGTTIWKANGVTDRFLTEKDWMTYLYSNMIVTGATMAIRASLMDGIQSFPEGWPHDAFLAVKAAALDGIVACNQQLILYRQHESNTLGMREIDRRTHIQQWIKKSKNLVNDRKGRYERFRVLYNALESSFSDSEKKRMLRFLYFLKDLADCSDQPPYTQIPCILKHYRNGDFNEFYDGKKTALHSIIAAYLSRS